MTFLTETAASQYEGEATFYSDEDFAMLGWGGNIVSPDVKTNRKTQRTCQPVKLLYSGSVTF